MEYMPGRSVITVFLCPLTAPSLRSTVTPGKLPTCCFEPVSWLKRVVLPLFWLPTSAKVSLVPSGSVSSYPCMRSSMGSPIGASLITVISAPGITPISRKCWRRAPSPPTLSMRADEPALSSLSVKSFSSECFEVVLSYYNSTSCGANQAQCSDVPSGPPGISISSSMPKSSSRFSLIMPVESPRPIRSSAEAFTRHSGSAPPFGSPVFMKFSK